MNVDPVQSSSAGIERQTPERTLYVATLPASAGSENVPKQETASKQNSATPSLFPEHEVQLQLDTLGDGVVVYRVLDKQSGDLVLQVPSAEQLRGIHQSQELLQRIAARGKVSASDPASVVAVKGEGNNNGSKL